jgi:hypothetical protein
MGESTARVRLCPHCANSIAEDAAECFYCKADFSAQFAPPWLKREESPSEPRTSSRQRKLPAIPAKFIWPGAMLVVALLAFFAGGYLQRNNLSRSMEANLKQLQAKDLMIQSQEGQLAQTRQKLDESSRQLAEMKTQLEGSRKEVSLAQQRLGVARQATLSARPAAATGRTASRAPDASAPTPRPAVAKGNAASGVYETTRPTSVYEDPSSSARVVSQIERGTRINVVGSNGGWLEVRSRHGNPPGYVRSDDARRIAGAS